MTQPVEIQVGAGDHRRIGLALRTVHGDPALDPGHRQRTRRLRQAAVLLEQVADGGADLVDADADRRIHRLARHPERLGSGLADRDTVGEQADLGQLDPAPGLQRLRHAVGILRLDADHLHARPHRLDIGGDACQQAAAADRHEHRIEGACADLLEDFLAHGALTGDDVDIVVRRDRDQALFLRQGRGMGRGVVEGVAVQHRTAAEQAHRVDLDRRRGARHHDPGRDAQPLRRQGHALRMVAGRGADHAARALRFRHPRQLVVGAAQLE